jgi:hypothetical protein
MRGNGVASDGGDVSKDDDTHFHKIKQRAEEDSENAFMRAAAHHEAQTKGSGGRVVPTVPVHARPKEMFGRAKCIGQTFSILDQRTKSCYYRNICYNTTDKRFKLFVEPSQQRFYKHHSTRKGDWTLRDTGTVETDLPPENPNDNSQYWMRKTATNNTDGDPRGHMVADLTVSLSAANKAWSQTEWHMKYTMEEYDKVDPDVMPWAPDVMSGPIPAGEWAPSVASVRSVLDLYNV